MSTIKTDLDALLFVEEKLKEQNYKCLNYSLDPAYKGYLSITIDEIQNEAQQFIENENSADDLYQYETFLDLLSVVPPNAKCAVGHLISDEHYSWEIEENDVTDHVVELIKASNPEWDFSITSVNLVKRLQIIHDNNLVSEWKDQFDQLKTYFTSDQHYVGLDK